VNSFGLFEQAIVQTLFESS